MFKIGEAELCQLSNQAAGLVNSPSSAVKVEYSVDRVGWGLGGLKCLSATQIMLFRFNVSFQE